MSAKKRPSRKNLIRLIYSYSGDRAEMARHIGCAKVSLSRWISDEELGDVVLQARLSVDRLAEGNIIEAIERGSLKHSWKWLNRSDKLRELEEAKSAGYEQPPRERMDVLQGRSDVEGRSSG